jgi:hypothetical protein
MPKRRIDAVDRPIQQSKRRRIGPLVQLDDISDELVLRILSYLSPDELGITARLSRKFLRLANDNESWKERYYAHWVRPRVLQIPSTTARSVRDIPRYSAKSANWLDHRHLVFPSKITDWKWQYRIKNNWHRGTCNVQPLEVSQPPTAAVIIRIHDGYVFEAGANGLRAWGNARAGVSVISEAFATYSEHSPLPTAMTIDASHEVLRLGVGFSDSSFRCYEFSKTTGFVQYGVQYFLDHLEPVSALKMSFPFVFAHVGRTNFILKRFDSSASIGSKVWKELAWLQTGRQHECPPSLALRRVGKEIAASVAYTSELVGGTNWCLGIQEIRISGSPDADVTYDTGPIPVLDSVVQSVESSGALHLQHRTLEAWTPEFPMHPAVDSRPKALSYSHPYLLAALPDNTLMVYLVTSTSNKLSLSDGSRLWGHTSGVSGVAINARGKAVTTSTKGGEIRVWDLEGLARGITHGKTSTPLVPTQQSSTVPCPVSSRFPESDAKSKFSHEQIAFIRSWIAFDDEQVLVLGEGENERTLSRYDFTK